MEHVRRRSAWPGRTSGGRRVETCEELRYLIRSTTARRDAFPPTYAYQSLAFRRSRSRPAVNRQHCYLRMLSSSSSDSLKGNYSAERVGPARALEEIRIPTSLSGDPDQSISQIRISIRNYGSLENLSGPWGMGDGALVSNSEVALCVEPG